MDEDISKIRKEIRNGIIEMEHYPMNQFDIIDMSSFMGIEHRIKFFCTMCCNEWSAPTVRALSDPTDPLSDPVPIQCKCGSKSMLFKRPSQEESEMIEAIFSDEEDGGEGTCIWEQSSFDVDGIGSIYGYILPKNVGFVYRNLMDYAKHEVELTNGELMEMDEYFLYRDMGM